MTTTVLLERTFEDIRETINWIQECVEDLETSMPQLAQGKLPIRLWPVKLMKTVTKEVTQHLPDGWTLTNYPEEEAWEMFGEAKVTTMMKGNTMRLFVNLPIYDRRHRFKLFAVHQLPVYGEGDSALIYDSLPELLAISDDAQSFMEASQMDLRKCREKGATVCHFHGGAEKGHASKSCAAQLFLGKNRETRKEDSCRAIKVPWKGSATRYLGERRWAISDTRDQEVTIVCPEKGTFPNRRTMTVPTLGIIELPLGCSEYTTEWWFPASIVGTTKTTDDLKPRPRELEVSPGYEEPRKNSRQGTGQDRSEKTNPELDRLIQRNAALQGKIAEWREKIESTQTTHQVPGLWSGISVAAAASVGGLALLAFRVWKIEKWIEKHDRGAVTPEAHGNEGREPQTGELNEEVAA